MSITKLTLLVNLFCTTNLPLAFKSADSFRQKNFTVLKDFISSWSNSTLNYEFASEDNSNMLYSVRDHNEINGYVVMDSSSKTFRSFYEGKYLPTKSEFSSRLNDGGDSSEQLKSTGTNSKMHFANKSVSNYSFICNPDYLCSIESSSQAYSLIISNCPEYYNEIVNNGCTPTSAAMLIAFYDRYSDYSFYPESLPLKHDDNKAAVSKVITELAQYRKTNDAGTLRTDAVTGLSSFLKKYCSTSTNVRTTTKFDDYRNFVAESNNPAIVHINQHAILGIGYAKLRKYNPNGSQYIQNYIVSHYDWRSRPGNYYVESDQFEQRTFITK